jgi:uncharacterized protein (DUF1499 family)
LAALLLLGVLLVAAFWTPLTTNWAALTPDSSDPGLRSLELPYGPNEAVQRVTSVIATLPRWMIVTVNGPEGTIHATHTTRVWRFVDDVKLRFESLGDGRCRMTGESRSRIGKADLGQNARNLKELRNAVEATNRARSTVGAVQR